MAVFEIKIRYILANRALISQYTNPQYVHEPEGEPPFLPSSCEFWKLNKSAILLRARCDLPPASVLRLLVLVPPPPRRSLLVSLGCRASLFSLYFFVCNFRLWKYNISYIIIIQKNILNSIQFEFARFGAVATVRPVWTLPVSFHHPLVCGVPCRQILLRGPTVRPSFPACSSFYPPRHSLLECLNRHGRLLDPCRQSSLYFFVCNEKFLIMK